MVLVIVTLTIYAILGGIEGAELGVEVRAVHLQIEGEGEVHGGEGRSEAYLAGFHFNDFLL